VLLVEDNPADAELVRDALVEAQAGATLVCVDRISEALSRAREGKWDVVLLDLSLPDAHELSGLQRLLAAHPDLAIVVLTSLEDDRVATRAVAEGAQDYLLKSQVQPSVLVRSIRYAIERQHHAERVRALADTRTARLAAETAQPTPLLRSCPTDPLRVLLVEDNPADADLVREALAQGRTGADLVCVERVSEALERAREGAWDVVLLDLSLPDAQDLAGAHRLRVAFPQLPIIVLTSLEDDRIAAGAVAEGAQDYLLKGQIEPSLLVRSIRYAIERQHYADRARLLAEERAARLAAETAQRRALLLSEVSGALFGSLDDDATLGTVARVLVRELADWCVIELGGGASAPRLTASAHVDQTKEDQLRRLREHAPSGDAPAPRASSVTRTGRSELHTDVPEASLAGWARDREELEALRAVGLRSAMIVPIALRGRIFGAMTLAAVGFRRYGPEDLALADEIARRLATALDNSRLHREARHALSALRASESRFRAVLDQVEDYAIFVLDREGRVASWSNGARLLKGWAQDEILGKHFESFFLPEDVALGKPAAELERAAREGHHEEEGWRRRKDGSRFLADVVITALRDEDGELIGFVKVTRDVTEQRRTEQNREFLAQATHELASALDPIAALNRLVRLAVPRLADLCGVDLAREDGSAGEFVATASVDPVKERAFAESRRLVPVGPGPSSQVVETLRRGEPVFFPDVGERELKAIARSPEHVELVRRVGLRSFMSVPLRSRGVAYGAVLFSMTEPGRRFDQVDLGVATDLARRAELAIDNARLFAETQRAVRVREDVLAVVSHDLRSPLQTIDLAAQAATRAVEACPAECTLRRPLGTIQRAARSANVLLHDLLDMASIRAGRIAIRTATEDAAALAAYAVQAHEELAREKGISLTSSATMTAGVLCDRDRVQQVFSNVIANAVRVCGSGDRIDLTVCADDQFATFSVADSGPGIPVDTLPLVFEAYWSSAKHRSHGTGLGLFISKGIVEAHGGRMWIESRVGEGTNVRFTIPIAAASH
jgi:PAS domain S-box-containing protein